MSQTYYYDDPEIGLSPKTSHPNFVQLARGEFYYDMCDNCSPFGNDDGFDAWCMLVEWYQAGKDQHETIQDFLSRLLQDWHISSQPLIQHVALHRESTLGVQRFDETLLAIHCHTVVACAFGQLKITGLADWFITNEALLALDTLLWFSQRKRIIYPNWQFTELELARLQIMRDTLQFHAKQLNDVAKLVANARNAQA